MGIVDVKAESAVTETEALVELSESEMNSVTGGCFLAVEHSSWNIVPMSECN